MQNIQIEGTFFVTFILYVLITMGDYETIKSRNLLFLKGWVGDDAKF